MENLKEKTAKGIAWGAVNNGTTQIMNLLIGIILARKLSEADYGIVALITIFTTLAGCIQSAGFSQALANLKPPTFRDYNAVCWFNIIAGFSIYIILFLCAPLIAYFFEQPILTDVSRLAFLAIPLSALGIVPNAKLWIELRNRELAIASIAALALSGTVGIWLAFHRYGYWSLVWQQLIFIGTSTLIKFLITRWTPKLPVDFTPIKQMFGFSSKLLLTSLLTVASQNVQTFIFGKLFHINILGLFSQANKWNFMGHSFISNTMAQVAQPVLSQAVDDDERQQRMFRKMLRFSSLISFPLMFGLALVAHEFIIVTIGMKWEPSVILLQLLCIGGAFMPLHTLYQNLIISRGRSDIYLWLVTLQIALQIGITLTLSPFGITAMVIAFSALNILFVACWHIALQRIFPLSVMDALKDITPFMTVAVVVMLFTYYITEPISQLWILLLTRIGIAAICYIIIMRLLNVAILKECLQFIRKKS